MFFSFRMPLNGALEDRGLVSAFFIKKKKRIHYINIYLFQNITTRAPREGIEWSQVSIIRSISPKRAQYISNGVEQGNMLEMA